MAVQLPASVTYISRQSLADCFLAQLDLDPHEVHGVNLSSCHVLQCCRCCYICWKTFDFLVVFISFRMVIGTITTT